jgi:hypothetical protein
MLKKKVCLGSAQPPVHPQHLEIMTDYDNWQLVDLFIDDPEVMKMDARTLDKVPDGYLEHIYASHLLEHIPHPELYDVLTVWKDKLEPGGQLTINVPDLAWAARQILKFESGQLLTGVYCDFEGDRGLQTVIYGSHAHEGERHQAGFTKRSLFEWLEGMGFKKIHIEEFEDAHDMGVLLATCQKP